MALIEETKKPWLSKQVWLSVIVAGASFIPGAKEWLANNMEVVGSVLGGIILLLRVISNGKISIGD